MPRPATSGRRLRTLVLAGITVTALATTGLPAGAAVLDGTAPHTRTQSAQDTSLNSAFAKAAERFGVPRDLLAAVGYGETHLDGHQGKPSQANGYGVMHLVSNPGHRTLHEAAELTGLSTAELRRDSEANILGAAAVLRSYADKAGLSAAERGDLDAWYPAVARYSGSKGATAALYADTVYDFLAKGLLARTGGEEVTVVGRSVHPDKGGLSAEDVTAQSPDYPPALWVPASTSNYAAGRSAAIDTVVIHVTQGSYAGTVSWFQNPEAQVSAHYVVRSSDGEITQMVRDGDTAWHARDANSHALGIEHEGFVDDPSWFTDAMYRSSAALTKHLCDTHGIPKDRAHILGHVEVPGNDHTDPGPHWNWDYYMQLVGGTGVGDELSFPSYTTQQDGASGAQVKAVQKLLKAQDFDAGEVDGKFGPTTVSAVKAFQKSRGLTADGVVGAKTWTALLSAGTKPTLKNGSSGEDVKRLQRALTAALGSTVKVDGSFGATTETAVRSFQKARGLSVDGIAGAATWTALQSGS
ncbi:peptidoglycan-binding protein [Streptomyces physcomitrii]|uniref:N-acetylmuramoyl-L-alanine amidase n=1 Tax=Streptomyces physcomitrii TaxID=2724184 RepID=A0ABX1GXV1_9ACTN|nr:peptidoglycan-binding protein [Streptomyces physcomitrii]NKI40907.1 N-acetylmuramoyl-L-alanine amidase [Streptomyces physcomitrii]